MKRSILFFVVIALCIACASKNEFGKKRFKSLSPYQEKLKIVDSVNVFDGYYKLKIPESQITPGRQNFIVFYEDGKVGRFLDYTSTTSTSIPKRLKWVLSAVKRIENT
jgi:hypothetical protein